MATEHFGRYELRGTLGKGGMATVHRAWDPLFRREVAIKVLSARLVGDAASRARFEREAHAVAGLEHAAIVPVYDYGEHDGEPYLVFRLLSGGSLADRIALGPVALHEAQAIFRRVASALDHAHARGVVHRDIKPANILFDEQGEAWLGDFGIARMAEHTASLTGLGVIGSPYYMSPEQAEGKDATPASDIYSLGATAYEALAGQPPFAAENPLVVMLKHVREEPAPLVAVRRDLPPAAVAAVSRAMTKDPAQRFASASAFATALAPAVDPAATQLPSAVPVAPATPARSATAGTAKSPVAATPVPPATPPPAAAPRGAGPAPARPGGRGPLLGVAGAIAAVVVVAVVAFAMLRGDDGSGDDTAAASAGGPLATPFAGGTSPVNPVSAAAGTTPGTTPGGTAPTRAPGEKPVIKIVYNPAIAPFNDSRVRQALSQGTNGATIVWVQSPDAPAPSSAPEYDVARAKQLLAAAGYGSPTSLRANLLSRIEQAGDGTLTGVVVQWTFNLGAAITLQPVAAGDFDQKVAARDFQAYLAPAR